MQYVRMPYPITRVCHAVINKKTDISSMKIERIKCTMGNIVSRPHSTYVVSNIPELKHATFVVQRSSGVWDEGHTFCLDLGKIEAMVCMTENDCDYFQGERLAARQMYSSRAPWEAQELPDGVLPPWRLLLEKKDEGYGWRRLSKIRPTGMSEEDTVQWRKDVSDALDKLSNPAQPDTVE